MQAGYVLLLFLVLLVLLMLAMMAAAPDIARDIQRDRELEAIHRGQQYSRAIRKFYKKFGRYPSQLKDLQETNHLRFIRKLYKDPLSKDGEWRALHVGEVQYTPGGFFGQSLIPQTNGINGATNIGSPLTPSGSNSPSTSSSPGFSTQPPTVDNSATSGTQGSTPGGSGSPQNSAQQNSVPGASLINTGTLGGNGQTFGGAPIVGVSSTADGESLIVFNNKDHYKDWLFIYDPRMEVNLIPAQPATQTPNQSGQGITPFNSGIGTGTGMMPGAGGLTQPQQQK